MKNQIKTVALLAVLSALVIGIGGAIAPQYLFVFVMLALAINGVSYFFADRLVLRMSGAQEVGRADQPHLHDVVGELAARAGIPKPRVCVIPASYANAFATGRNPAHGVVAVTSGLLDVLSPRELRGVLAHEIAHIKNRDILIATVAAAMAAVVTYIAHALQFSALFGSGHDEDEGRGSWMGALLMALVAPVAATLIQLAVSRSREYVADRDAARIARDPDALADALERLENRAVVTPTDVQPATASLFIVNPLAGAASFARWFSTHPPMRERVRRLRDMTFSTTFAV